MIKAIIFTFLLIVLCLISISYFDPYALLDTGVGLLRFALAAMVLNVVLRLMDRINGLTFKDWYSHASPNAKAAYFSARIIIVGLLAAACIS
ncbi:hypothetical protein MM188_003204 [Vibrio cholerae]|nr:hypothetical protein [Vibrio cholerae]